MKCNADTLTLTPPKTKNQRSGFLKNMKVTKTQIGIRNQFI